MNRHERGLEFKVGAFVFVGLAMLGALVVQFGRLGEGFKNYYPLTVRFNDASGLLKGSDVLLGGARVGKVADGPRLVREGNGVLVPLKIYDYMKIPETSKFTVGSSGLLGDRFVNVTMPSGTPTKFLSPNTTLNGARETGIDDLTREGGALVGDLRGVVQKIDTTVTRLNDEVLSKETAENLKSSVAHLNEATRLLPSRQKTQSGRSIKPIRPWTRQKKQLTTCKKCSARRRKEKDCSLPCLRIRNLANDLRALVSNMRAHGVLFYRDTAAKPEATVSEQTKPARGQSGS